MASVTIIFAGQEQKNHALDKPKMIVGREPTCEIHIDNLGISRQHCQFSTRGEAFVVQDLGSSNGTFVNGRKITEHFLNDGDEVVIGKYTLKFKNEFQSSPKADAAGSTAAVPDTLNTYVMDGAKIHEQLAKMREQAGATAGASPAQPPVGATAKDYAKALDPGTVGNDQVAKLKNIVAALSIVVVVLLVFIALLMLQVVKIP